MKQPLVSVIIPAYKQAEYLGEAIQSVLDQTYSNLELIVVNDASPDNTDEVVRQFTDPRLKYIVHDRNKHLAAARNTGIRASSGEFIALLDADDKYHPKKLQEHITFLNEHPEIGVSYNSRFEMDVDGRIFGHWPVPPSVGLPEFVLGFPFGPSDMIIRREWIFKVDLFDESYVHFSEDLDIYCRLALEGCQFGGLTQALNYRRYYAGRIITQAFERANAAVRALETVFADPRCPADILALRNQALGKTYLIWSHEAFLNNQTELGQEYIRKALELDPSFLENKAGKLFEFIVMRGVQDAHKNDELIPRLFSQLPPEINGLQSSRDQILGRIYLVRCICEVTWNYESMDDNYFSKAAQLGAQLNKHLLGFLTFHMMNFEAEFGLDMTIASFERLTRSLAFAGRATPYFRWMMGGFLINKAYKDYRDGKYANVPSTVVKAILNNPSYLVNRGVASIFVRSLLRAQPG